MSRPGRRVLVVGGGRWARTILMALREIGVPGEDLAVVSGRNEAGMRAWLGAAGVAAPVWPTIGSALADGPISAAVVAGLPAEHSAAARTLLSAGIPTLIEKPVTASEADLVSLLDLAAERGVRLAAGHELMFVDELAVLGSRIRDSSGPITMWWHENPRVHRDGSARTPDLTTGALRDYLPHLLSVLDVALGLDDARVEQVTLAESGVVRLALTVAGRAVDVSVSRTRGPQRGVALTATATLDLATDPPTWSDDVAVHHPARPLQRSLQHFLDHAAQCIDPAGAASLRAIVGLTEAAQRALEEERGHLLSRELRARGPLCSAASEALAEDLAGSLLATGLMSSPKDRVGLDRWSGAAWTLVGRLAEDPFVPATELARAIDASPGQFASLADVVASWDAGQRLIMAAGPARKYWTNTIAPLLQSGTIADALEDRPSFPFRIGLYPGLSCMFHCSFCGRAAGASYDRSAVDAGVDLVRALFDEAPVGDPYRFYISGGLEPLTNPRIGEIVRDGAERGFALSMYTNALMLTPTLLRRQPGLWNLDTVRVSLYGTDAPSALQVTGHKRSFDQVVDNVVAFLQARQERGSTMRVGFNHVILPGRPGVVDRLVHLLADIHRRAGTVRGIDFLTLREDYSVSGEDAVSTAEREELRASLTRLRAASAPGGALAGLMVDLGYALDPLLEGWPARELTFAAEADLRPRLYPQVSVAIDTLGDVYGYREAAFPERPGGSRYIIGRLDGRQRLLDIVSDWVNSDAAVPVHAGDGGMLDIFDHVVTLVLNRASADTKAGFPASRGPMRAWRPGGLTRSADTVHLAHPFPMSAASAS